MEPKKTYVYKFPEVNTNEFPLKPISDWVTIEKIPILDNQQKSAKKSNLVMVDGLAPKNILELQKQKENEAMTYEGAEAQLLKLWDEHPFQGIVKAIGNGRSLGQGSLLEIELKPGDHVLYRPRTGEPIMLDHKIYWMIKEHEIFAIVLKAVETKK